jgi:MarR family transcriptional regulator, lower aerobic nicotinate degradation pathway regulator
VSIQARKAEEPAYRLDDQIGYLLGRAQAVALGNLRRNMGDLDLTPPQLGAILKLMELGQVSQNELGRQSGMKPATVHGVIQRLQKRGLVDSSPSPEDQRRRLVFLTQTGTQMAATLAGHSQDAAEKTLSPLTIVEQGTLNDLLCRVIAG